MRFYFSKLRLLFIVLILPVLVQGQNSSSYKNPIFNYNFPDPNLVKGKYGYFYAYATQSTWNKDGVTSNYTIPILKSKNLVKWEVVGDALAKRPDWKDAGGIWAPDALFFRGKYYLYYSFSTWGDPNPGIGLATSKVPEGPFTDHGKAFLSKEIGVANSIDPVLTEDKGKLYLVWGSFHGIYGMQVTEQGETIGEKFLLAGNAYEASYIYKQGNYYYFFGSVGTCCEGAKSTYHIKVGRSKSIKGPYVDREGKLLTDNGGTLLLKGNPGEDGFVGPGHNGDLIKDKNGDTWMLYHAFSKKDPGKRVMLLDKVEWKDGWPWVKDAQPSISEQIGPKF